MFPQPSSSYFYGDDYSSYSGEEVRFGHASHPQTNAAPVTLPPFQAHQPFSHYDVSQGSSSLQSQFFTGSTQQLSACAFRTMPQPQLRGTGSAYEVTSTQSVEPQPRQWLSPCSNYPQANTAYVPLASFQAHQPLTHYGVSQGSSSLQEQFFTGSTQQPSACAFRTMPQPQLRGTGSAYEVTSTQSVDLQSGQRLSPCSNYPQANTAYAPLASFQAHQPLTHYGDSQWESSHQAQFCASSMQQSPSRTFETVPPMPQQRLGFPFANHQEHEVTSTQCTEPLLKRRRLTYSESKQYYDQLKSGDITVADLKIQRLSDWQISRLQKKEPKPPKPHKPHKPLPFGTRQQFYFQLKEGTITVADLKKQRLSNKQISNLQKKEPKPHKPHKPTKPQWH